MVALAFAAYQSKAQSLPNQAKPISPSGFDVSSLSKSIMDVLGPSLSLTDTQKPSIASEVTSFLTKKKDILPLQATNKAGYTSKLSGLANGLTGK